jgi:hypothetical protein
MIPKTRRAVRIANGALAGFALLTCGLFSAVAAQTRSAADNFGAASSPTPKPDRPQDKSATDVSAAQKPAKPHKVITNDDIDAAHGRAAAKSGGAPNDLLPQGGICDDDCAHQAREQLGIGPEREGEWQMQLAAARRNLAGDARWRQANFELTQAVQLYCTYATQQRKAALPTGDDWNSRVERGERQQYADNMGRTLSQKLSNATAGMNRLVEETRDAEPARAAMMSVLASRLLNSCPYIYDP